MSAGREMVSRPSPSTSRPAPAGSAILGRIEQRLGNRGLQQVLRHRLLQAKLNVSQPDDAYEQEADRVADEVMRTPEPAAAEETPAARSEALHIQRKTSVEGSAATPWADVGSGTLDEGATSIEPYVASLDGRGQARRASCS
jgi:hypothetical protein